MFDPTLTEYDFGAAHPMSPVRVDLTMRLADELGVLANGLTMVKAPMADDDLIATVHDRGLIEAVLRAGNVPGAYDEERGLGTDDNPVFRGMHHAAAHVVGAPSRRADRSGPATSLHSANIAGGLHHAMRDRAAGFCIFNDVAVGIQYLLDQGAERVAYVDIDVHHGDGVERYLLGRRAGAHDQPARDRADALPGHRFRQRCRGSRRAGDRGQRGIRPAPLTPAGCARSTRWSRRCCAPSTPTCWSPSTAATPTSKTRLRI